MRECELPSYCHSYSNSPQHFLSERTNQVSCVCVCMCRTLCMTVRANLTHVGIIYRANSDVTNECMCVCVCTVYTTITNMSIGDSSSSSNDARRRRRSGGRRKRLEQKFIVCIFLQSSEKSPFVKSNQFECVRFFLYVCIYSLASLTHSLSTYIHYYYYFSSFSFPSIGVNFY